MAEYTYPTAFNTFGDEENAAALRVLASGRLTIGAEVALFEAELAEYHGKRHCIMCNSGSSANLLMVAALFNKADKPLRRGDKVLVPAVAWSTTYAPLVQYGLDLTLIDVDETWNATPRQRNDDVLKRSTDARLIVGCSILGNAGYLGTWRTAARSCGAYFIEDNCESLGARTVDGDLCGTFGVMSSTSFFFSHQLNGIEGGAVLTDDDELADLCRMLRAHGWTRDVRPRETFQDEYDFRLMGYNLRPLELHAAVARVQLAKLDAGIAQRALNAVRFYQNIEDLDPEVECPPLRGLVSMFGIHFLVPDGARPAVVAALRAAGVDCRLPAGGSFGKHAYGLPWANQSTPHADRVHDCGLFIGNAPFDLSDKVDLAAETIARALNEWRSEARHLLGHNSAACDPAE